MRYCPCTGRVHSVARTPHIIQVLPVLHNKSQGVIARNMFRYHIYSSCPIQYLSARIDSTSNYSIITTSLLSRMYSSSTRVHGGKKMKLGTIWRSNPTTSSSPVSLSRFDLFHNQPRVTVCIIDRHTLYQWRELRNSTILPCR